MQHIETRTCRCMSEYNWLDYYVLHEDFNQALPIPITSENIHLHYTRGMAERTVSEWNYTGVSVRSRVAARAWRAWIWVVELPQLFVRRHDIVYMGAAGLVLFLVWVSGIVDIMTPL